MATNTTIGRVLHKDIKKIYGTDAGDVYYRPVVTYEYTVHGRRYECDQVTSWQVADGKSEFAERVLARYKIGTTVTLVSFS